LLKKARYYVHFNTLYCEHQNKSCRFVRLIYTTKISH
jgi:hypothetical protein